MKLATHHVEKPWGRTDLPAVFAARAGAMIGEVWFDAPERPLPLLVKWLFTSDRLSIQVHPDDAQARAAGAVSGKEECWVVTSAEPGATLGIGTLRPLAADELRAAVLSGEIEALMDWKPVRAGDFYFIPAGTVHAIGAGVTLVEVQQNADITYRLYDYGRPRALHLNEGLAVSRAEPYTDPRSGQIDQSAEQALVDCPHFALWHLRGAAIAQRAEHPAARWVIPLSGTIEAGGATAGCGECLYLEDRVALSVWDDCTALVAFEGSGNDV
jgi:mannose-6-phosphate isomerase